MTLTTPAWPDGDPIPVKYTQAGEQVSPALNWTNTPPGTVSFLLHMLDPDVARNKTTDTQVHWLVWNIPATATGLPTAAVQNDLLGHVLELKAQLDNYASGNYGKAASLYRDAYNHMFHTGDLLAGAIAKQKNLR